MPRRARRAFAAPIESDRRAPVGIPAARQRRQLHSVQLGWSAGARSVVGGSHRLRHRTHARNQAKRLFRSIRPRASTGCLTHYLRVTPEAALLLRGFWSFFSSGARLSFLGSAEDFLTHLG